MSDFYTANDPESLTATSSEDALEDFVSALGSDEDVPSTVVIQGYNKRVIQSDNSIFSWNLDRLYEELDEEFDPKGDVDNRITSKEKIEAAYAEFLKIVIKEYRVWSCDPDGDPFEVKVILPD